MKVLAIDDNAESIQEIADFCGENKWDFILEEDLIRGLAKTFSYDPDVIILDWSFSGCEETGISVIKALWENGLRHVVIYSGKIDVEEIPENYKQSPLIKTFIKGTDQEDKVTDYLLKNVNYIKGISEYRRRSAEALIEAYNAINSIRKSSDNYLGDDVLEYILAKRTEHFFNLERTEANLPAWGMYIFPPIGNSLCACDIIREIGPATAEGGVGDATEYMLVLTPSCDMVSEGTRNPKVNSVLCSRCVSSDTYATMVKIDQRTKEKKRKSIDKALKQGHENEWCPLPKMVDMCPCMWANLKELLVVDIDKIATSPENIIDSTEYVRVGSIDSPFREQIIWAYMQNACRPGVPDRNFGQWAEMMFE